jgi:hypothetical protein
MQVLDFSAFFYFGEVNSLAPRTQATQAKRGQVTCGI